MPAQYIVSEIEKNYSDIKLEDGISLNMTEYLDSYQFEKKFLELAKSDERDDWTKIPDKILEKHSETFCFTDWKGFRFYIPAYMRWCLNNSTSSNIIGDMTIYSLDIDKIEELYKKRIKEILNLSQIETVVKFLEWCCFDNNVNCDSSVADTNLIKFYKLIGKI